MRHLLFLICGFLLALDSRAASLDCSSMPLMTIAGENGELALYLPSDKVVKTPHWSPSLGEPPLAMDKIVEAVEKWAAAKHSDYERVVIDAISLRSYRCPDVIGRWYYIVEFFPMIDGDKKMEKYSMVGVLLDGTVIGLVPKK